MLILTREAYNMTKSDSLKLGMIILFVASVVCAVVIKHEQIRFIFTAVAFLLLGFYNTAEYRSNRRRSALYFSIMFYCFCLSALAFATISKLIS